jgi:hypothetical protein
VAVKIQAVSPVSTLAKANPGQIIRPIAAIILFTAFDIILPKANSRGQNFDQSIDPASPRQRRIKKHTKIRHLYKKCAVYFLND